MGNFASTAFRTAPATTTTAFELPSDAVVVDCAWLEATHAHFKDVDVSSLKLTEEPAKTPSSSVWVCDAVRRCRQTLRALVARTKLTTATASVTDEESTDSDDSDSDNREEADDFFDEFHQVFEPNAATKKSSVPAFVVPTDTVVKTIGRMSLATLAKMRSFHDDEEDSDEEEEDFEDCASYTTDATDSLSESECEGKCFAFCGGLECEPQDNDGEAQQHDPLYSDDEDDDEDEDCLARAERLLRMASSCDEIEIFLDDYLCTCGECPQYKLIAYEVQRYGTYANDAEKLSLTRILQAFSTYNEVIGYDCDMIPTAEECLQVWAGDEDRAFQSFAMLYDEVPHLCA